MSSDSVESSENVCVVCFKNVDIYSIGICDHMVCYECSTRMRVLCSQTECPICRQDLPKVIFTYSLKPFSEIASLAPFEDKKNKIHFQNKKIQDAFYKLLEHYCNICQNRIFKTFQQLYDHMRREHELYYCDLCVDNLKIFTSERRCYTKTDLAQHRRKGDPDDRSHRGHPLCEFCQVRFMDNDFLYRHLRKDHLFCHFCDADGHDLYYSSYDYLRDHFREEHFLCEEGACVEEKFTPVFRTEIDLKAHRMSAHGKSLGKAAAKQARTLELEFTLKPRLRQQDSIRKGKCNSLDAGNLEGAAANSEEPSARMHSPTLDPSDFPSLPSGSGTVTVSSAVHRRGRTGGLTIQAVGRRNAPLAITDDNFPVLREYNDNTQGTSVRLNINQERNNTGRNGSTSVPRIVSINVNHRPNGEQKIKIRQDEFPALSSSSCSSSIPAAKWVSHTNKKASNSNEELKESKQQKQPLADCDFPGLSSKFNANLNLKVNTQLKSNNVNSRSSKGEGKNSKKVSSVVIPVGEDWLHTLEPNTSTLKTKTKKKKSKGNNSEEKSDTVRKKEDKKASNNVINENSQDSKITTSAYLDSPGSTSSSRKPLPTAEDWFGCGKKHTPKSKNEEGDAVSETNKEFGLPSSSTNASSNVPKSQLSAKNNSKKLTVGPSTLVDACIGADKCGLSRKSVKKAPPGFDHLMSGIPGNIEKSQKPPPGFTFDFPHSNGLTFTNSCGQSFSIQTNYAYIPPLNFEQRNQNLVSKVFNILSNENNLEQFKRMSALFRQDMLSADDYCNHCIQTMGGHGFGQIFPELLSLLPDIGKQQELYQVFLRSQKFNAEMSQLQTCETCRQVICSKDMKEHMAQHALQENFPLLMPSNWTK